MAQQFFKYTVSNGLATQGGELFSQGFRELLVKTTKAILLKNIPVKGSSDTIDLVEFSLLDPRKNLIINGNELLIDEVFSKVEDYTVANGRVYGSKTIYLNREFAQLTAVEILGVTAGEDKLVEVKNITDNTVAIITLTDWNNLFGGPL
jgi:hypothetical protein